MNRSSGPKYGFLILNRLDYKSNLIEKITGNLEVEDDDTPFLIFRSTKSLYLVFCNIYFNNILSGCFFFIDGVYKMWFFLEEDRKKFASEINELIKTEGLSEASNTVLKEKESNQVCF